MRGPLQKPVRHRPDVPFRPGRFVVAASDDRSSFWRCQAVLGAPFPEVRLRPREDDHRPIEPMQGDAIPPPPLLCRWWRGHRHAMTPEDIRHLCAVGRTTAGRTD